MVVIRLSCSFHLVADPMSTYVVPQMEFVWYNFGMETSAELKKPEKTEKKQKKGMTAQTRLILAGLGVSTAFIFAAAGFATYSITQNMML